MVHSPCKDCPDRHYACWGSCAKYQAFRTELAKVRKIQKEESFKHSLSCEGVIASMKRGGYIK